MFQLRSYQRECLEKIAEHFSKENKQLVQLPTGSGKTVIFWEYIQRTRYKTLIIVPSVQLLLQVRETGWKFNLEAQISCKGGKFKQNVKNIHIVVSSSLNKKYIKSLINERFDLIICDEAHKSYSPTYLSFFDAYLEKHPNVKILGLTATPERTDAQSLLSIFDHFTYSKEIYELIDEGHLSDLKAYSISTEIELKSVSIQKGDFTKWSLIKYLDCDKRNTLIFNTYEKFCKDRKTLIFCINTNHSRKISNFFNSKGIPCCHIDGLMNYNQRKTILDKFESGEIKVLTNCQLLTEGFDEPSIDALIIARPTKSKILYTQMIGRGTRLYPNKEHCLVLELADNGHKICNFNVLANLEYYREDDSIDYSQGITLTALFREKAVVEAEIQKINEKRINLFESDTPLWREKALDVQIKYLINKFIYFQEPISFEEASFLIWLDKYKKNNPI